MIKSLKALLVVSKAETKRPDYLKSLKHMLAMHQFSVIQLETYCKAISHVMREKPDLLLTTEGICDEIHSEISLIGRARAANSALPIILLLNGKDDSKNIPLKRAEAYRAGADDVLISPYNDDEIFYRLERVLQRSEAASRFSNRRIEIECLRVNADKKEVFLHDTPIDLTQTETDLLHLLLKFKGEYLSKPYLQMNVLKRPYSKYDRSVDMHISNLRKKLAKAGLPESNIFAVRGYGYCFR